MAKESKYHFATNAIHAGGAPDKETGPATTPPKPAFADMSMV